MNSKVIDLLDPELNRMLPADEHVITHQQFVVLVFRQIHIALQLSKYSERDFYSLHAKITEVVEQFLIHLKISLYRQQLTKEFRECGNHIVFNFDTADSIVSQSNEMMAELK